jgi:hypothetical protein
VAAAIEELRLCLTQLQSLAGEGAQLTPPLMFSSATHALPPFWDAASGYCCADSDAAADDTGSVMMGFNAAAEASSPDRASAGGAACEGVSGSIRAEASHLCVSESEAMVEEPATIAAAAATAVTLCNNALVRALLNSTPVSGTDVVAEMGRFLQQPPVYSLIAAAGLEWCRRDVDERKEHAVVECFQHHGVRAATLRRGAWKTRIVGYD